MDDKERDKTRRLRPVRGRGDYLAAAPVSAAPVTDTDDGAAGVGDEIDFSTLEGIGLSLKAGWYTSMILYGFGGVMALVLYALSDSVPGTVALLGIFSIAFSGICVIGVKLFPSAAWGPYLRISLAIVILGYGGFTIGPVATAMLMIVLFTITSSAYLYPPRISAPYCAGTIGVTVGVMVYHDQPATFAIATGTVLTFVTTALIFSQFQLRAIARINHGLSVTDPLTGVANLRRLRARIGDEILSARRTGHEFALFAVDLDDFKEVNDRFSHTVGDELLKEVAAELRSELEPGDLLARRGGDEFSVLAPAARDRHLGELAARLRRAINRARTRVCPDVTPHGSVGYVLSEPEDEVDDLIHRADDALHEAKLDAHPERRANEVPRLASYRDVHQQRERMARGRRAVGGRRADHHVAGSADEMAAELEMARWAQRSLGTPLAWFHEAVQNLVVAGVLTLVVAAGLTAEFRGAAPVALIGALWLSVPAFVVAARRSLGVIWLHGSVIATFALLTALFVVVGDVRWMVLDLYLVPVFFAFYFFEGRQAAPYLVACFTLFIALLATSHYEYTVVRALETPMIVGMAVALLAKARRMTRGFTERAIDVSVVDPLTGLANLRGLRRRVADEINRCELTGERVVMLAIDLDDFKSVNDTYNHARGDAVLVATAAAIRDNVREDEMAARRGGDEFAAVFVREARNVDDVVPFVLRLADAIERVRGQMCPDLLPTASIGYVVSEHNEDIDSFLARADQELHGAKEASRERRAHDLA